MYVCVLLGASRCVCMCICACMCVLHEPQHHMIWVRLRSPQDHTNASYRYHVSSPLLPHHLITDLVASTHLFYARDRYRVSYPPSHNRACSIHSSGILPLVFMNHQWMILTYHPIKDLVAFTPVAFYI